MKRWGKSLVVGLFAMVMSMFWAVGCSDLDLGLGKGDGEKLDAVSQSTISASLQDNQLTVYWGAVQLATAYEVTFNGEKQTVSAPSTSAIFTNVQYTSGSLTISIVARAVGFQDSATTTYTFTPGGPLGPQTLAAPTGLAVRNGTLNWNAVANATSYTVSDGTHSASVSTNSIALAANGLTVPTSGSIVYTVIAKAAGYTDSAAAQYTYTVGVTPPQPQALATPTGLAVRNGTLSWNAVTNATSYTVSDGTKTVSVSTNSIALAINGLTVPTSGSITYTVIAKADGFTDSAAAPFIYTYTPPQPTTLAIPTGLLVAGGKLMWTAVANATSYVVSDGTTTKTVNTNEVDLAENGFTVPDSGSKTYTVIAKANGYNDSPSASYTHTFEHMHSYDMTQWTNNKTHHWHAITCGHSVAIEYMNSYGAHEFGNGNTCSVCNFTRVPPIVGQYVYYGEYPQTLKDDSVTVGNTADANGYYTGSDGEKYVKVTATPYVYYQGFRTKFANGEWITTGSEYYFKVEPIKWRVLANGNGDSLLFCDTIIDHGAYYNGDSSREIGGATVYPSNYAHSDIRTWLNGTFYTKAFSSSEQQGIKTTTVDNGADSTGFSENTYICEDTQDKVFLLSNRESYDTEYGFIADGTESDAKRMLIVSDYARAIGAHTSDSIAWAGCGIWWMRSPMWDSEIHVDTGSMSGMVSSSKVNSVQIGIAPAMRVSISAL